MNTPEIPGMTPEVPTVTIQKIQKIHQHYNKVETPTPKTVDVTIRNAKTVDVTSEVNLKGNTS